jgi:hypothetical protein
MLKLLLDEQISPDVADGLKRRSKQLIVYCVAQWQDGRFLALPDESVLEEAGRQHFTLVTYDRKTIPPVLKRWGEEGRNHGGVVFVDPEAIPPSDFGGLIRGLKRLWDETDDWDWENRVVTLRRSHS